jgi:F5/8 type C domain
MKKKALNHQSYNAIIAASLLIGILLVGLVENIYQEAKAQSVIFDLPRVTENLSGLERGKIQIEKIINSILTGVTSHVQKTRLPILNEPPILSDAKREMIQKAEERTHLYGPPLPRSNQPIFGPLYQTQVRLAVANQTGNSDIRSYLGQITNNQRTSNLANNDTSSNNSSRCQSLPVYAITNNGHYGINIAINTLDRNYATYWSNLGRGSWIQADLGEEKVLCSLDIAWYRGNLRHNNFEVSVSNDSSTFRTVLADESSGTTRYFERYVLPQIVVARYVKIIVNGNSENSWASITEINLNGYSATGSTRSSSSSSLRSQEGILHSQNMVSPIGIQIYTNKSVTVPRTSLSLANEPSVANRDKLIFYTGNWYDVRSLDGGSTWTYIDPFKDMHDFCCDQDIIYDSAHQIFIWYRLGTFDSNGENHFRLGISSDTSNWLFYNVSPRNFNGTWSHQFWDYPQLALSNKYLYITSNMFDQSGKLLRTIISRWSLQDLSVGQSNVSFSYYSDKSLFNFTPVQGATDTMYWASHVSNSRMRIFRWSDTESAITSYDREIPAWTSSSDVTMSCKGPDSNDWCGRADSRILGGWLSQGTIAFMWMASAGNGFPWPYLNAAKFRLSDMKYLESPYLWSPDHAWMYGSVSPNSRGDLGIVAFYGGGKVNPSLAIGISQNSNNNNNDTSQLQSAWKMEPVMRGTNGPSQNDWGDFLRIRPYSGSVVNWVASGYILKGGSTEDFIEPLYLVFGPQVNTTTINSTLREPRSTVTPASIKPQGGDIKYVLAVSSNSIGGASSLPSIDNKKSKYIVDKRSTYYYHPLLYSPMLEMMSISSNNSSATNYQVSYSSFTESKSDSSNLRGNIYFEGLNCNPKKTNITVPPCSGRYPNYEVLVSSSKDCKTILSKTKSDQNGSYRMRLPPGNYVICPKSGNASPPHPFGVEGAQPKPIQFIIKEGIVTNLDLVIRTGIR